MDYSSYEKKTSKKILYYRKRVFGISSLDRTEVKEKSKFIQDVQKLMLCAADDSGSDMDELFEDLRVLQDTLGEEIRELEEVDPRNALDSSDSREMPYVLRKEKKLR